jgi:hypothetical protein
MSAARDAYEAYSRVREENLVYVGQVPLRFSFAIDPTRIIRPLYEAKLTEDEVSRQYVRTVEDGIAEAIEGTDLRVAAEPWGGPKTGGPIPDQTYAFQVVGFVVGVAATIVVLADFADLVVRVMNRARELTRNEVAVSNGDAVALVAKALLERTDERDLSLAFATPLNAYLSSDHDDMDPYDDGWLVGFRSADRLHTAHVDRLGRVTLTEADVSISWTPR